MRTFQRDCTLEFVVWVRLVLPWLKVCAFGAIAAGSLGWHTMGLFMWCSRDFRRNVAMIQMLVAFIDLIIEKFYVEVSSGVSQCSQRCQV